MKRNFGGGTNNGKPGGGYQPNNNSGNAPSKRARFDDDDDMGGFDDGIGDDFMMDENYFEKIEGVEGDGSENDFTGKKWIRPKEVEWDTSRSLAIHWLDIDMISGQPLPFNPAGGEVVGAKDGPVPIIRMYGVTSEGNSALVFVHGVTPYLYASINGVKDIPERALGNIRAVLDQKVSSS